MKAKTIQELKSNIKKDKSGLFHLDFLMYLIEKENYRNVFFFYPELFAAEKIIESLPENIDWEGDDGTYEFQYEVPKYRFCDDGIIRHRFLNFELQTEFERWGTIIEHAYGERHSVNRFELSEPVGWTDAYVVLPWNYYEEGTMSSVLEEIGFEIEKIETFLVHA